MKSKQFYSMPTTEGLKLININNIASIETKGVFTMVTLNVTNKEGKYISFTAQLEYGFLTGNILGMDQ